MTPADPSNFADDARFPGKYGKVSKLRGGRTLYIYKPYEEIIPVNRKLSQTTEVGGFGIKLFGSTESKFDVIFEKNIYYPGDTVAVKINCDNS